MDDPFSRDDAEVGGSIEDLDPNTNPDVDLSTPEEVEQEGFKVEDDDVEPNHSQVGMAWYSVQGLSITEQFSEVVGVVALHRAVIRIYKDISSEDEKGLDDLNVSFDLDSGEKQLISLGLHLIGFFAPDLGEATAALFNKFEAVNEELDARISDERKAEINAIGVRLQEAQLADRFGITLEEFKARQEALRQDIPEGVWGSDEGDEEDEVAGS